MEQLDTRLKQIEMQLQRSQEEDRAKREEIFKELSTRCFQCGQLVISGMSAVFEILKPSRLSRSCSE
jgi:hypothetical protein